MGNMLDEALYYAKRGWYVFPCREKPSAPYIDNNVEKVSLEKTPYTTNGLNDATTDADQIRAWWTQWEDAMIGVNAGLSGLFVVDIDKKNVNGFDTYSTWNINDSAGLKAITPSGGMHIIFSGAGKTSSNGKLGIDTRGEGGYFIAPPSKILAGERVGEYVKHNDWTKTPGKIPGGLMSQLFPKKEYEYEYSSPTTSFTGEKKKLSYATMTFIRDGAPVGERNATLFKALADLAGCGYSKEEATEYTLPVSDKIGLPRWEFQQVLKHAYDKPRTSSIPDSLQEKLAHGGKDVARTITFEEQDVLEYAVIASLLMDNTLIGPISDMLSHEDFKNIKNNLIYKIIVRMYNDGLKVDQLTLNSELQKQTTQVTLDDIGKMIDDYFVNTDHIMTYANIIKEKSAIRRLESLLDNKEKYLEEENFIEMVSSLEEDIANVAIYGGANTSAVLQASQAVDMVRTHLTKIQNGEMPQLKTGFTYYDNSTGGIYPNELIICAGRAGEGKSALALSILNNISIGNGIPTAMFSLEMSTYETVSRLICQLTGLNFREVYQGDLTDAKWDLQRKALDSISNSNIYFDEGFGTTVPEIRSKIRKLVDKGVKLVVIDQLEQIRGYDGLPPYVQFDKIAYDLKRLTLEFNVPILLNHQLNRNVTNRSLKNPEPQLADLNQAGEKPANQVWVITHRKDEKGTILKSKIKILKNRNGVRGDIPVVFMAERMLFGNPTTKEEEEEWQGQIDSEDEEVSLPPAFARK